MLEADLGRQLQGPQAGRLVKSLGTLVQQGPQCFGLLAREGGAGGMGTRRASVQTGQANAVEGPKGVADGLVVAAQVVSNLRGQFPLALARRTWQRRRTKASDERKPASNCGRSASLKGRTKMGLFMTHRITHNLRPILTLH